MLLIWGAELWGYHFFQDRIRELFVAHVNASPSSVASPALREFQLSSFGREVGWRNPEVLLSWLSLGLFWFSLRRRIFGSFFQLLHLALGLSAAAVFLFYGRYTPCQPAHLWNKLLAGGPQQQEIIRLVSSNHGRIWEETPDFQKRIFPNATACLYGVHVVHGYSALQPQSTVSLLSGSFSFPISWVADWKILADGTYRRTSISSDLASTVRFVWEGPKPRLVTILHEDCKTVELKVSPGPAGRLIRTDTFYPGWRQEPPSPQASWHRLAPCFSEGQLEESVHKSRLRLVYSPRFLNFSMFLSLLGVISVILGYRISTHGHQPEQNLFRTRD